MIFQTLKFKGISGFVLILALMTMVGVLAFREINILNEHASCVEHTHEAISLINRIQGDIIHAESGQRGYLLTGNAQYLTHYNETLLYIDNDLEYLHRLTGTIPEMKILADSLSSLTNIKLNQFEEILTVYGDSGLTAALEIAASQTNRHIAQEIHEIFNEMRSIEYELLTQHKLVAEKETVQAKWIILTLTLFAVVVTILFILLIVFRFVLPISKLTATAEKIADGNLSAKAEENTANEIGILSASLNKMADSLIKANVVLQKDIVQKISDQERLQAAYEETKQSRLAILSIGEDLAIEVEERKKLQALREKLITDLKQSNRDLEQFAYVASHDLQEPLRMVSSFTQLLAKRYSDQLDDDAREFINYAVDGANRMQRQITDLLQYSRVSSRGKPLLPVDSHSALGEAVSNLKAVINENQAMVFNQNLPLVLADRSQLVTLFQNLIGNAIKFHGDKSPIVNISAEREGLDFHFRVSDNGIGIEDKYFSRIFTIFQRLHTIADYSGTGIGLAVCERIVTRHGGKIWVESEPDSGSVFHFTLRASGG